MTPRASFVIPAYNAQAWIAETLKSCVDQTIKQIEMVVVNDGSTDYTREIVESLAKIDQRIILVDLIDNVGRSAARNIGNAHAKGEIILVLDSDDKAARNRVKDTITCFELKRPDLVYGGFQTIDSLGNIERKFIPNQFNRDQSLRHKTHGICHSTLAYKKAVAKEVLYQGGDFSRLGIDDWRFIWDCDRKGYKFAYVKHPLAYYRMVEGTITSTRDEDEVLRVKDAFIKDTIVSV